MSPSAHRWRPRRAGIVGLYEYGDQVFELAGGRLLLRGHNTSGKTKALELLLPFCLDGDTNPNKLDPFGGSHKTMWWNVVGCSPDEKRTGYVWLELERLSEEGRLERLTCGIGLRANRSVPGEVRRCTSSAVGGSSARTFICCGPGSRSGATTWPPRWATTAS